MDIRILGAGSGMPSKALNCSAILVQSQGKNYLLDAGEGVARSLLPPEHDPDFLDAIIITHLHPDHVGGLFLLIQMLYLAQRNKALPLFLPERENEFLPILEMLYTFPEKFGFELQVFPMTELKRHFKDLDFMQNDHLAGYGSIIARNKLSNLLQAYSIRVNNPNGDFVYSSDITSTDSISELIRGAHTLLVDAGHPEAQQILKLQNSGIKRILLTHEPKAELTDLLRANPCSLFEETVEGKVYHI